MEEKIDLEILETLEVEEESTAIDDVVSSKKKKRKRKRKRHQETEDNAEVTNGTMTSTDNNTENGRGSDGKKREDIAHKEEEGFVTAKKKRKEKNQTPSMSYDLEVLFSLSGRRAQGTHLNFSDIRTLMMLTVHGSQYPCLPTWCKINAWHKIMKTVVIMAGCISTEDYNENKDCFKYLSSSFGQPLPVRNEGTDVTIKSPLESLLRYRMPKRLQQKKKIERDGAQSNIECHEYVLTKSQLCANDFPEWNSSAKEHGVVTTQSIAPTKDSKLLAIDCEMCNIAGGYRAVTRISVVDTSLETVYDKLVKPEQMITDYLTQYSGITAQMLENVTTRLTDVQEDLLKIIQPDTILVGHSLDFDLRALKIHHENVIDTSVLYVDQRGARFKSALRFLVKTYLNRDIQNSDKGHCSVEDAKACMELALLKIQKGFYFGNPEIENESVFEALSRVGKRGAIIDTACIVRQHCHGNNHSIPCTSDDQVVSNAVRFVKEVDFTFAHLKTYENMVKGITPGEKSEKDLLKKTDRHIKDIISSVPTSCLVIVSLSSGFIPSDVMTLVKDKEKRKCEEVKAAIRKAKDGLCFVKIT